MATPTDYHDKITEYLIVSMPYMAITPIKDDYRITPSLFGTSLYLDTAKNVIETFQCTERIGKKRMARILDAIAKEQAEREDVST